MRDSTLWDQYCSAGWKQIRGPEQPAAPTFRRLHAQLPAFLNSKHGHMFSFGKKLIP